MFKRIGQPVVLGYLLAGLLVGPEVSFLPTVEDRESIKVWAEIGVIVLLFGLGLEFSFKKLMKVGRGATVTAITEVVAMLGIGYVVGRAFGWNSMDSIFLGGILSISSTTIIIRAVEELGYKQRGFVSLVFGVLIVEDLVAILLMVLLSTIAVTKTFEGVELLSQAVRLGFVLTLWFLGGTFLIPWFLRKSRPLMNEEMYLIVSLGLCFLMVVLASYSGFSPALGAFIMGSIIAETRDGERIEHYVKPVKDLFAAVFFVSVGMLIEFDTLRENWMLVVVLSAVTIVGKLISTTLGSLISGGTLRHSVQAGMSLAQIGEFSFIIATLGLTLKVTSDFLYPLAVAVSAVTTFTTPYLIRSADWTHGTLTRLLPAAWVDRLERGLFQTESGQENVALQASILRVFFNTTIVVAIMIAAYRWLLPMTENLTGRETGWAPYLTFFVAALISLPFVLAVVSVLFGMKKNTSRVYEYLENRFLTQLNERENAEMKMQRPKRALAPWDAHLTEIEVHPDSIVVGKSLFELGLREKLGVTVALIERGSQSLIAPNRNVVLMGYDRVSAIGTDEQLSALSKLLKADASLSNIPINLQYGLRSFFLGEGSKFAGKSIRESGLREAADGLVVGLERNGQRILNPDSSTTLQVGDNLWIVGDELKIRKLID